MTEEDESYTPSEEGIYPPDLINEVKKWPAIYDKSCPDKNNFKLKLKIWAEIASTLIPDWNSYSKVEKDTRVEAISKRWRHLRDKFKRQIEVERKKRNGYPIKKKPYIYFGEMMFLLPHVRCRDNKDDDSNPFDLDEYFEAAASSSSQSKRLESGNVRNRHKPPTKKKKVSAPSVPEQPLQQPCSSTVYVEEIDEDRSFLLSLLPSFKRFSLEEKLTAKVEILLLIQKMTNASNSSALCISQCSNAVPALEVPVYPPVKVEYCQSVVTDTIPDSDNNTDDSE